MNQPNPPTSMAVHLLQKGFAVLILIAVAGGIYFYLDHAEHGPGTQQPQHGQGPPMKLPVMTVAPQTIPYSPSVLARAEAYQVVEIRARIAGFLDEQLFNEGEVVSEDQQIFTIDPRTYEADVKIAEANLASAQATLKRAEAQERRYEKLAQENAATPSELEDWQTQAGVARANVQLAQASLDQAQLNLSYTRVTTPITGFVGINNRDVGSYVDAGSNGLLTTVRQIDPIYVTYTISEQDLLGWQRLSEEGRLESLSEGKSQVEIVLADGRTYPQLGTVNFVDMVIDPSDGTARVRAEVPNPDGELRPGQFVKARLVGYELGGTIMVPQRAVLQTPAGASIYVVDENNTVQMRVVTLGDWIKDQWVVDSGLEPGDRVLADGIAKVRPGSTIEPLPYEPSAGE